LWIASLPTSLQPFGGGLFQLGISRLLRSFWFWLPAALLLLHSLIILANYWPRVQQRWHEPIPSLGWQHPLARRIEHSVRLSDTPDEFLDDRRAFLKQHGFSSHETAETEQRLLGASRRRWAWGGVFLFYGGLIGLIGAFFISHFFLEQDYLLLSTLETTPGNVPEGNFTLAAVEYEQGRGQVTYRPTSLTETPHIVIWRRYWPTFLRGVFIFPTALTPLLSIEIHDENNTTLTLLPSQGGVAPTKRLDILLDDLTVPILFSTQNPPLAFQISPDPSGDLNRYNVQVRQAETTTLIKNIEVEVGQPVEIETLIGSLALNYKMAVNTRRDPALWLYPLGLILIVAGLATFFWPPAQVWLIPEVKGRGGQLYGVLETFGSQEKMEAFLERLLAEEQGEEG
jgi:hypothetical protein